MEFAVLLAYLQTKPHRMINHWMKLRPLPPLRWAMLGCPGRRLANCRKYQMSWWNWWQAAPGNRDSLAEYAQNQKDQHFDAGKHCRGLQRRCHHIMNKHHVYIYIYVCILFGPLVCTNYGQAFGPEFAGWVLFFDFFMLGKVPEEFAETCEGRSGFRFCESVPKNVYCIHMTNTTSHITPFCWRNTLFVPWEPNAVGGLLNLF